MVVQVQLFCVISQELFGCSCCFQHSFTFTFVLGGHSASQKPVPDLPRSRSQRFSLVLGQYRWFWQPCDFKALCYLKNLETNTTLPSLYMESAAFTWHRTTNNSLCRCLFLLCAWPFQYCSLYQWCGVTDRTTTVTAVIDCDFSTHPSVFTIAWFVDSKQVVVLLCHTTYSSLLKWLPIKTYST